MRSVYIVGGMRTPFVKSLTSYTGINTQELMTASLQQLVERFSLHNLIVGDVAIGGTIKNSLDWDGMNEEYAKRFPNKMYPARHTVQVGMENRIEIACVALIPKKK